MIQSGLIVVGGPYDCNLTTGGINYTRIMICEFPSSQMTASSPLDNNDYWLLPPARREEEDHANWPPSIYDPFPPIIYRARHAIDRRPKPPRFAKDHPEIRAGPTMRPHPRMGTPFQTTNSAC